MLFLDPGRAELLAESGTEEAVLRTLRMAGFERACVGEDGGTVVVRLELPEVRTPGDIEMAWQTGVAVAAGAYQEADAVVVQIFYQGSPLLEVEASGEDARLAVDEDQPDLLRDALTFRYLTG
jgi:hypothetical protein